MTPWNKVFWIALVIFLCGMTYDIHKQLRDLTGEVERNFDCFKLCHQATWEALNRKSNKGDLNEIDRAEILQIQQLQGLVEDLQKRVKVLEIQKLLPTGIPYEELEDKLTKLGAYVQCGRLFASGGKPIVFRAKPAFGANPSPEIMAKIMLEWKQQNERIEKEDGVVVIGVRSTMILP